MARWLRPDQPPQHAWRAAVHGPHDARQAARGAARGARRDGRVREQLARLHQLREHAVQEVLQRPAVGHQREEQRARHARDRAAGAGARLGQGLARVCARAGIMRMELAWPNVSDGARVDLEAEALSQRL